MRIDSFIEVLQKLALVSTKGNSKLSPMAVARRKMIRATLYVILYSYVCYGRYLTFVRGDATLHKSFPLLKEVDFFFPVPKLFDRDTVYHIKGSNIFFFVSNGEDILNVFFRTELDIKQNFVITMDIEDVLDQAPAEIAEGLLFHLDKLI